MTVKEFIALLSECDPDDIIIMATDAEGNAYNYFDGNMNLHEYNYMEYNYGGEIKLRKLTPELVEQGFSEEDTDINQNGTPCVVLWP